LNQKQDFNFKIQNMKNISYWALLNPVKSIVLIVLCQTLLAATAIYIGVWLFVQDVILPRSVIHVGLALFFLVLLFYPIRRARHKIWKYDFMKQKSMDALFVCSFMMITIATSNSDANAALHSKDEYPHAVLTTLKNKQSAETSDPAINKEWSRKKIRRKIRKKLKSRFKKFVSEMKAAAKEQPDNKGKIVGMIVLTIVLMLLVVGLSCAAGCSGGGAFAAIVVLAVGWALALWLGISVIRRLKGKRKTKYEPMP
jgi:hypothetical protein